MKRFRVCCSNSVLSIFQGFFADWCNCTGRIHLSIRYPSLDATARLKIWTNFMDVARKSDGIKVDVDEAILSELAEIPLNGRQVRWGN
jgi:hypothetical protein